MCKVAILRIYFIIIFRIIFCRLPRDPLHVAEVLVLVRSPTYLCPMCVDVDLHDVQRQHDGDHQQLQIVRKFLVL